MSDAYIVRRGGGGEGFDANGAVLKVITSTGCTVLVTGTGYSKTHQQADGFPRSGDANVTEHFFSIPASAFGTITVKATNTYGDNTKTLTVNTAGKVYELLCGGVNIILDSTFGLQDGYVVNSFSSMLGSLSYDARYKRITGDFDGGNSLYPLFNQEIPVSAYSSLKITADSNTTTNIARFALVDQDSYSLCTIRITGGGSNTASISETLYSTAKLNIGGKIMRITEIVLS
jgi:hypothetical protein